MMKFSHFLPAALVAATLLAGCKADVDLGNVDTSTEVNVSLAMPVGNVGLTLGDIFGFFSNPNLTNALYFDSLDNKGVLCFKMGFDIERDFHAFDLSSYISTTNCLENVYDYLSALDPMHTGTAEAPADIPLQMDFPSTIRLNGINYDKDYERLDSIHVTKAEFELNTRAYDMGLKWEWVDAIDLVLQEPFFRREDGGTIRIYTKGDGGDFGQPIPVLVDNFTLNLMAQELDPEKDQLKYDNFALDSCVVSIRVTSTIPAGQPFALGTNAALGFGLRTTFIDYAAAWGMFRPSKDMRDDGKVQLTDVWEAMGNMQLPFAKPNVQMDAETKIAAMLYIDKGQLYTINQDAPTDTVYATFGDLNYHTERFQERHLDPVRSNIGDSIVLTTTFSEDPARGHIDRLFAALPDELGYKFGLQVDPMVTPQMRLMPDSKIRVHATATLPMIFNEGLRLSISDTSEVKNLSRLSFDSLLNNLPMVDTVKEVNLKLALAAKNTIPFRIKLSMQCLDENGQVVIDPETQKPLRLFDSETVVLNAPHFTQVNGQWTMQDDPYGDIYTITLTPQRLEALAQVKQMVYSITLDDESLHYAFQQGLFNTRLHKDSGIKLRMGIAANMDAILKWANTNQDTNQ